MNKKLYVRNLADIVDSDTLEEMFCSVGTVDTANVEIKSIRGNNYRVGYVEMATAQEAIDCIERFHGQKVHGQVLVVTEDKPHVPTVTAPVSKKRGHDSSSKSKAQS